MSSVITVYLVFHYKFLVVLEKLDDLILTNNQKILFWVKLKLQKRNEKSRTFGLLVYLDLFHVQKTI